MSHHHCLHACLPAPSPGKACMLPARPPQNQLPPPRNQGGLTTRTQLGMSRVPWSRALQGEEVAFTPSALRGVMHRGKGGGRGPEKSGSHRKRSLHTVSGSFQP